MTKIFLVEDEVYALLGLQQKILDLNLDYEIVGVAENGAEALKAIPLAHPDIVMTDIRMPDMDGITLIEKLRLQSSNILPIIVSGYQEFEYAKQAVKLGVKDYLLKPVNPVELQTCLKHCESSLKQIRSMKNVIPILIGGDSLIIEAKPDEKFFTIISLIFANALTSLENILHPNVSYVSSHEIEETFCGEFTSPILVNCFDGFFSNEKAIVLSGNIGDDKLIKIKLERLAKEIATKYGYPVTIYFAGANSPTQIASSIRSCRKCASQDIILGETSVTTKHDVEPIPSQNMNEIVNLFVMLLRQNENTLLLSNVKKMFHTWELKRRTALGVQIDLVYLLNSLKHAFYSKGVFQFNSTFYIENLICFSANYFELANNFFILLTEFFDFSTKNPTQNVSSEELVKQIEEYFKANLSSNITLQMLCDEMKLSKVYLCRIFKKQKDMTPIDYFTRIKIEHAKGLISQFDNLPLHEISDSLGFNDMYYFSKVFKRVTGVAPSEMRTPVKPSEEVGI